MTDPDHSLAFERIVDPNNVDDDVVGLLAYSYYKRDKRELAIDGKLSRDELNGHHKTLTDNLIKQYKDSALLRLEAFANDVLDRARPEIQEQTRVEEINSAKIDIIKNIRSATIWWQNILWNVIAWLLTLAITFLILVSTNAVTIKIGP
jgi:hypothetical protein